MNENIENVVKIEAKGFQDLCKHFAELEEKNKQLENENKELKAQNLLLKRDYEDFYEKEYLARIDECNRLWGELFDIKHMSLWEFANKYCNDNQLEEAGHQFARSLLGKPMTDEDLAIEAAENNYVPYEGDDF